MASDELVSLKLNWAQSQAAILPQLERLLDLLKDALIDPDEGPEREPVLARIADYRQALHAGVAERIEACGEALLSVCSQTIERHKKHRLSMRTEIADLVKVFNDVTATVAGEGKAAAAEMAESATRFQALGQISDIRLLKDRLSREVVRLRETAKSREERWNGVVSSLKGKVETLEEQLVASQQEATLDPLTSVANRRLFDRSLKVFMKDGSRRFGLVFIDVDDFKHVNDEHGHEAGDKVLQAVASVFATSVRSHDLVARMGGDEFAVLLENVTLMQATARVTQIVSTLGPTLARDGLPHATVSCGVAEFSAGDTPQSITKRADEALYDAKRQGKGRVGQRAAPLIRDLRR